MISLLISPDNLVSLRDSLMNIIIFHGWGGGANNT